MLEIGAGEGAVGARLARSYRYVGLEPDQSSCAVARARIEPSGGRVVCGDITALEAGDSYDLLCAFEVLEHVAHDAETLAAWAKHVKPGGWMMLSVPPFQRRFGLTDRAVGHFRRYEPEQIRSLMLGCGLRDPKTLLYGFPIGYALDAAKHSLARVTRAQGSREELTAGSGRWFQPKQGLGTLITVLAAPFSLIQRPFHGTNLGSGMVAIARRPAESQ